MNDAISPAADREIGTTRTFDAPRELVWEVWTDPDHITNWWGPYGFTTTTSEYDLRPGGKWLFTMRGPDGTDYRNDVTFTSVVEPELLEYDHGPSPVFSVTVRFDADGESRTKLSMRMLFPTAAERDRTAEKFGAIEGQKQTMNRLEEYLAKMQNDVRTS
jgi:uncharacterized protein YndB with AHSA1/START domain